MFKCLMNGMSLLFIADLSIVLEQIVLPFVFNAANFIKNILNDGKI